jgi:hypothetical protein
MTIDQTTTNNLLFLLAAAPLGMGCIIVTDDVDDTTGADTGNSGTTAGSATTDASTGPEPTSASGEGTGGSSGGTGGTDGTGSSSGAVDSTGNSDSTGGGAQVCADYGTTAITCLGEKYGGYAEYNCNFNLDYYTNYAAACGAAYEDYIACLSALTCEEFMGVDRCPEELAAFMTACPTAE